LRETRGAEEAVIRMLPPKCRDGLRIRSQRKHPLECMVEYGIKRVGEASL
jgi:hypothetical protein